MSYESRQTAEGGVGLFAALNDIPVGICFMTATPSISLESTDVTTDVSAVQIYKAFNGLAAAQKGNWLQLTYSKKADLEQYGNEILQHLVEYPVFALVDVGEASEAVARFYNNAFTRDDGRTRDLFLQPVGPSQINHSCVPNANYIWNSTWQMWEFRATRVIRQSEEITIAYVPMLQPTEVRRDWLRLRHGFECLCKACDLSTVFGQESVERRRRLAELNDRRFNGPRKEQIEACQEMLQLLESEEITSGDVWHTHARLGELMAENEWQYRAVCELAEAAQLTVLLFGNDHPYTKKQQDRLSETRARFGYGEPRDLVLLDVNEASPSRS